MPQSLKVTRRQMISTLIGCIPLLTLPALMSAAQSMYPNPPFVSDQASEQQRMQWARALYHASEMRAKFEFVSIEILVLITVGVLVLLAWKESRANSSSCSAGNRAEDRIAKRNKGS